MPPLKPLRPLLFVAVLAVAGYVALDAAPPEETAQAALLPAPPPPAPPARDGFDLPVTFDVSEHVIERGATFSGLLAAHGLAPATATRLADVAEPVFDIRHLRAGRPYRVYSENGRPRYLVYEEDPIHYVRFDLAEGSLGAERGERAVEMRELEAHGVVTSSLWNALDEEAAPELTFSLAEMYAWQIDFHRLQKGDRFAVVYEQGFVDGEPVGVRRIRAARFEHAGAPFYGFLFERDGAEEFFDEQGGSLRKAFLKAPVKFSRMSSGFTKRRFHPVQKRWKAHLGTDYAAPHGTPIVATGDGVVLEASRTRGNGNYVKIRHNGTYTTGYLHMSRHADGVKPGARVRQGDVIGYVGATGLATGPHVCYRFWKNGAQVDSRAEAIPPSHPVADADRPAFDALVESLRPRLDAPDA